MVPQLPLVWALPQSQLIRARHRYGRTSRAPAPCPMRGGQAASYRSVAQCALRGRVAFEAVETIHRTSLATVLLLPVHHASARHMTQRIFEAVLNGAYPSPRP